VTTEGRYYLAKCVIMLVWLS